MTGVEQFLLGAGRTRETVHVALVNNMPDDAMRATEIQFARLLKAAAGSLDVRLRLFSLRAIARSEQVRSRMAGFYDDAALLPAANVDALIITGAQPGAADLRQEGYWPELTQLIDWAQTGTISTLFSDLAAHGAVLHMDGIQRRPLVRRLSGVYDTSRSEEDALFFNAQHSMPVPHARKHDLAESELAAAGYRVLSRLSNGQVDIFTRELPGHSRFVYFQGHPEYDPGTLGRAYLRDLTRFVRGETSEAVEIPENYFDRATEDRLSEIRPRTEADLARATEIVTAALPRQAWRNNTVKLFGNWLTLVAAAKSRRAMSRSVHTRRRAS
jgi:homoserine O-succinyltransferase